MIASLNPGEKQARMWLRLTSSISVGACLWVLVSYGINAAFAWGWGSAACVLPHYIFANRLFAHCGASASGKIVRDFFVGEMLKWVSMAWLVWLALSMLKVHAVWLLGGFLVALVVIVCAPLLIKGKVKRI